MATEKRKRRINVNGKTTSIYGNDADRASYLIAKVVKGISSNKPYKIAEDELKELAELLPLVKSLGEGVLEELKIGYFKFALDKKGQINLTHIPVKKEKTIIRKDENGKEEEIDVVYRDQESLPISPEQYKKLSKNETQILNVHTDDVLYDISQMLAIIFAVNERLQKLNHIKDKNLKRLSNRLEELEGPWWKRILKRALSLILAAGVLAAPFAIIAGLQSCSVEDLEEIPDDILDLEDQIEDEIPSENTDETEDELEESNPELDNTENNIVEDIPEIAPENMTEEEVLDMCNVLAEIKYESADEKLEWLKIQIEQFKSYDDDVIDEINNRLKDAGANKTFDDLVHEAERAYNREQAEHDDLIDAFKRGEIDSLELEEKIYESSSDVTTLYETILQFAKVAMDKTYKQPLAESQLPSNFDQFVKSYLKTIQQLETEINLINNSNNTLGG